MFRYLAHTPEGTTRVLRESVAALFYANQSGAQPVGSAMTDAQQDAYFSKTPGGSAPVQTSNVQVVNADITLPDTPARVAQGLRSAVASASL